MTRNMKEKGFFQEFIRGCSQTMSAIEGRERGLVGGGGAVGKILTLAEEEGKEVFANADISDKCNKKDIF